MQRLGDADKQAWEPYTERKLVRADLFEIQRREDELDEAAKESVCRDWSVSRDRLDRIWWHNFYWATGIAVTQSLIDKAVARDRETE
jgi:hypothetical protein